MRDQTPWVDRYPSEYLPGHVRFCSSAFDGPLKEGEAGQMQRWMDMTGKSDLLMYGSSYPHWSTSAADVIAAGLDADQRDKVLWQNASELYGLTVQGLADQKEGAS
jgi:predicted TIM-barrel fold metal-dependent hydrolase